MSKGWIGVDLDGTLAHYEGWKSVEHIGAPIAPMVSRVMRWLAEGWEVKIFTARISHPPQEDAARKAIAKWLSDHGMPDLPVTNVKDFGMVELWDDRCVQVRPNTGEPIGESTRGLR